MRKSSFALAFALSVSALGCAPFGESQETYAKLSPEDRKEIDDIGPAAAQAVSAFLSGNLPGAVAAGVKAGMEAKEAAAVKNPDTGDAVGLWQAVLLSIASVITSAGTVRALRGPAAKRVK